MTDPEANPWQRLSSRRVYDNPWIGVREDQVIQPGGNTGIYGVVEFKNRAVGVIPIDSEQHTWLVGQYRYALGRYEWEIPEGGCPGHETPEQTAGRELREETGLIPGRLELILEMQMSNSCTNELGYVFVARDLSPGPSAPEASEQLQLRRLPLAEAIAMAASGDLRDSLTVAGLLKLAWSRPELVGHPPLKGNHQTRKLQAKTAPPF